MKLEYKTELSTCCCHYRLYYNGRSFICWDGMEFFFPDLQQEVGRAYTVTMADEKFNGGIPIEFERGYQACWFTKCDTKGYGLYDELGKALKLFLDEDTTKILWVKIELDEAQDS